MFLKTGARIVRHHDNFEYAMIYGSGDYDDCDFLIITGSGFGSGDGSGDEYDYYGESDKSHVECGYS